MVENWDQYKDLEYYPDRVCKCGCGGRIKVRPWHKYKNSLPEYLPHHQKRNRKRTREQKRKQSESQKGEKNSNWRGGKLEYKCKWCGNLFQAYPIEKREFCWDRKCVDEYKREKGLHVRGPGKLPRETRTCACGCGETFEAIITSKKRYINGHQNRGRKRSLEYIKKMRGSLIKLWQNPDFVKMMIEASHRKPNELEKKFNKFLQRILLGEYQINVRAEVLTLGGKIPDFINVNGQKKIIEMNGDWWHGEKLTGRTKEEEEQQRIDYFAQYGWETLIVWEHELEDMYKLEERVLEFHNV